MQPPAPTPPSPPSAPEAPKAPAAPKFTIADAGFLAGTWRGEKNGGVVEEMWSEPQGNNILGTFRWLKKDGKPVMFEMLAITEEDGAVRLRLRHYSARLGAKEDKDNPLTLILSQFNATDSDRRAVFTAERDAHDLKEVVYDRKGDSLAVDVAFVGNQDGTEREPLKFKLRRHVER
ncbi:MAG: hypothetical protein IT438_07195 [Phycisphaerales bacterium]|nr:hypothetical protein [Phycisphaerales bacterium]